MRHLLIFASLCLPLANRDTSLPTLGLLRLVEAALLLSGFVLSVLPTIFDELDRFSFSDRSLALSTFFDFSLFETDLELVDFKLNRDSCLTEVESFLFLELFVDLEDFLVSASRVLLVLRDLDQLRGVSGRGEGGVLERDFDLVMLRE